MRLTILSLLFVLAPAIVAEEGEKEILPAPVPVPVQQGGGVRAGELPGFLHIAIREPPGTQYLVRVRSIVAIELQRDQTVIHLEAQERVGPFIINQRFQEQRAVMAVVKQVMESDQLRD